MRNKDDVLFVRTTPAFKGKVKSVAEAIESDLSQFVRDAVTEKIDRLAKRNRKVADIVDGQAARQAA